MRSTFFPLELRFHSFFHFLVISRKCHNPLENHGRNEHHIFFIFAFPNLFLAWRWKMLFLHCVLQCFIFFSEMVWSIEVPFSWRKNLTFVGAETGKFYISHGWLKLCGTYQPFEVRFVLFCCFCSEVEHVIIDWRTMDEMKNAPFSSSCPQRLFEAVGRSESTIGFLTVQSQGVEDRVKTRIFMNIIGG